VSTAQLILAGVLTIATVVLAWVAIANSKASKRYLVEAAQVVEAMKAESEATNKVVGSMGVLTLEIEKLYSSMFRPYVTLTLDKLKTDLGTQLVLTIANKGGASAEDITFHVISNGNGHNEALWWMGEALLEPSGPYGPNIPQDSILKRGITFLAPGQVLQFPFQKDPTYVHTPFDVEIRYFSSYSPDGTRREYKTPLTMDLRELRDVQMNDLWSDREMRERRRPTNSGS
jgi:hypothetical protein